ncbi:MAG: hypothetical protein N2203_04415 [Bacteroidia bacterium]|nr:hypothetical protein [Bacteroidia bacterium]
MLIQEIQFFAQTDSTYFKLPEKNKEKKEKNFEWMERVSIGGNFAFFTSSRYTFIDISPLIGYRISKMIMIGAGPVYNYYSEYVYNSRFSFDMYGLRCVGRIYLLESLFFQTGWDLLNRSVYTMQYNGLQKDRMWIQNIWIGGGVRYMVTSGTYMFTSVLFNLNQNNYSPYPNPYVQIGFITSF